MKNILTQFKNEINTIYILNKALTNGGSFDNPIVDLISNELNINKYNLVEGNKANIFNKFKQSYLDKSELLTSYLDITIGNTKEIDYRVDQSIYGILKTILNKLYDDDESYWYLNNEYLISFLSDKNKSYDQNFDDIRLVISLITEFSLKLKTGIYNLNSGFLKQLDVIIKLCELLELNCSIIKGKLYE